MFECLFTAHTLTTLAAALNPLIYALPNAQVQCAAGKTLKGHMMYTRLSL